MRPDESRPDLAEALHRRWLTTDDARPDVVRRRHDSGRRTARENLDDLLDAGSFVEYGGLAVAAQRARRSLDDLVASTPADGIVGGVGRVNDGLVGSDASRCAAMSYDYTVLAGTQGITGHHKTDRLLDVVQRQRLPVVLFAEGGGGRPGDTDVAMVGGLDLTTFSRWAGLSGLVPRIGVAAGNCFAGNAALFGMCDVTIAAAGASIGMGGPAMIEGGGLGVVAAADVGPLDAAVAAGVVDIAVADDAAAVAAARQALGYFQGPLPSGEAADQALLRDVVPERRRRAYDVRRVLTVLADTGSVLELRPRFARGMVTAFARVQGRPLGILANQPLSRAGAITSDGADKAARFLQLCDAFDLPVLSLCDTPGIMVGPDAERTGLVRHASRLFVAGATLSVPMLTVVLRRGYGLGAMAMAGGSFANSVLTVAWPTGEFGGMGLEGAVRLGMRRELDASTDPAERQAAFDALVAAAYERGKALSTATFAEIDDVIDPAETRGLVAAVLGAHSPSWRHRPRRRVVDTW